jgi:GGDEF domain-containing protein
MPEFPKALFSQLPFMLLGVALLLGIYFQLSRIAFAAALLLAVFIALDILHLARPGDALSSGLFALLAVNIALISATADRSLLSGFGLLLLFAVLLQVAVLAGLQDCCAGWELKSLFTDFLPDALMQISALQLIFAAAVLIAAISCWLLPGHITFGLFALVILLLGVTVSGVIKTGLALMASASGLLLILLALCTAYELAFRDELTGIPSRRAYSRYLLTLGRRYSIAVVDIDHFKKLNDRHGHQVGDQALRMVAGKIARFSGGRAFRYGGEEFVVVLRGQTAEQASQSLERMREKIASYRLRLRAATRPKNADGKARGRRGQSTSAKAISTTVSIGLASSHRAFKSPQEVMNAADKALYKAKRAGRNRLCLHAVRK